MLTGPPHLILFAIATAKPWANAAQTRASVTLDRLKGFYGMLRKSNARLATLRVIIYDNGVCQASESRNEIDIPDLLGIEN